MASGTIDPALEMAQLEIEAKANARKNVAGLLQVAQVYFTGGIKVYILSSLQSPAALDINQK